MSEWSNSGKANIGGDSSMGDINKTTTNTYGMQDGVGTSQLWVEFLKHRQQCEDDKKEIVKKIDIIQNQRINDMRRVIMAMVAICILFGGIFAASLFQPAINDTQYVNALEYGSPELEALSRQGNPTPPDYAVPALPMPTDDPHCIVEAISENGGDTIPVPVCFDSYEKAVAALSEITGYDAEGLSNMLLLAKRESAADGVYESAQYQAVIGAWFSQAGYNGSTTLVYSNSDNGCYGGQTWVVPVITQHVASALKMAGCWTNTIYSDYYWGGAIQWCNCPTVGLSDVRSARYSP